LFPKNNIDYFVTGYENSRNSDYIYCSVTRNYDDMSIIISNKYYYLFDITNMFYRITLNLDIFILHPCFKADIL